MVLSLCEMIADTFNPAPRTVWFDKWPYSHISRHLQKNPVDDDYIADEEEDVKRVGMTIFANHVHPVYLSSNKHGTPQHSI